MCQLTFSNCNDANLNASLLLNASIINSREHQDGWGFYWNGYLYKSAQSPHNLIDIGTLISKQKNSGPILSHVRRASFINGIKKVDQQFSHPFSGTRFVVAHNGTLESKTEAYAKEKRFEGLIDSQIFAITLEDTALANPNLEFPKLIKLVTDMFYGKFAFLIFDKLHKQYYAVRGDTADLHYADLIFYRGKEPITSGYIINTEAISLNTLLIVFNNNNQVNRNIHLEWDKLNVKLLDKNSVFLLEETSIKKVGEVEQTTKPVKAWENPVTWTGNHRSAVGNAIDNWSPNKFYDTIFKFIQDWDISLVYLDEWLYKIYSKPMLSLEYKEIKDFAERILPLYIMKDKKRIRLLNHWRGIKNAYRVKRGVASDVGIHVALNLMFPYFDNTVEVLKTTLDNLKTVQKEVANG